MMKNRMCRQIMMTMMVGAIALSAVGCQKAEPTTSKQTETKQPEVKKEVNIVNLADRIVEEGSFKDELNLLEDDMFSSAYECVEETLVKKARAYIGSGATSEQVVIVEAKDADSAKKVKDQLQSKVESDIEQDKDYLPNEIPKLKSAVLKVSDKYVILVVSDNNSKAADIVNKECE